MILGSETGSGKTLAYLLPLINHLLTTPTDLSFKPHRTTSIIVCPNKELVQQILHSAAMLSPSKANCIKHGAHEDTIDSLPPPDPNAAELPDFTIASMPGGYRSFTDFPPWRHTQSPLGSDIVVTTPAAYAPLALDINNLPLLSEIDTLVVDECDMLLDGGYLKPLNEILTGFRRRTKLNPEFGARPARHVFVGATIPNYGLRSVDALIGRRFPLATRASENLHNAKHAGLAEVEWVRTETDAERFRLICELLRGKGEGEKIIVFVNTVEGVEILVEALR